MCYLHLTNDLENRLGKSVISSSANSQNMNSIKNKEMEAK